MNKKHSIFKQFKIIYAKNPWVFFAILWVSIVPSLGVLGVLRILYQNWELMEIPDFMTIWLIFGYLSICTLLMGLAFLPTTFLAVLSGFVFGWQAFPFLVLAYSLASILGYLLGKRLGGESLDDLLLHYPKAADLIQKRSNQMGRLVFYVRLSPVIPFALSNILFALLKVGLGPVVWAGLLGMLPRTFLAFLTGTLAVSIYEAIQSDGETWQVAFLVLLFLFSIWGIYRFFAKNPPS